MPRFCVWLLVAFGLLGGLVSLSACQSDTTTATAASVQPPAGWLRYSGGGVELYLPPYFDANMKEPTTVSSLGALGWAEVLSQFERSDDPIVVLDSESLGEGGGFGFVTVEYQAWGSDKILLEKYVEELKNEVSDAGAWSASDLTIDGREATKVVIEGETMSFVSFFVTAAGGDWVVSYAVLSPKLQTRLADVDLSAATFRILP